MELVVYSAAQAPTSVEQKKEIATLTMTALAVLNVARTTAMLLQDSLPTMTAAMTLTLVLMEVVERPAAQAPTHVKQATETATLMMTALAL